MRGHSGYPHSVLSLRFYAWHFTALFRHPTVSCMHALRHWKGTIEYHKTKDIIHVKQLLGHKKIDNTMIYINLERAIFKESNDEFTVKVVEDVDEARKLLEVGFEYVCDVDDKKLFRKRK